MARRDGGGESRRHRQGKERAGFPGENRLLLVPRDPRTLFAYWEIAVDASSEPLWLRLHGSRGLGAERAYTARLPVEPRGSRVLVVQGRGRKYRAEIGRRVGGTFRVLVRSLPVTTPPGYAEPLPRRARSLTERLWSRFPLTAGDSTSPGGRGSPSSPSSGGTEGSADPWGNPGAI